METKYYLITYKNPLNNILSEVIDQDPTEWLINILQQKQRDNFNSHGFDSYEYAILFQREITLEQCKTLEELGI